MNEDRAGSPEETQETVVLRDVVVKCRHCGYTGPAEPLAPGRTWIEAVLWIVFVVPGVLYSLWRLFGRRYLCPQCKASDGDVAVPAHRKVAMVLRAILLIGFLMSMAVLALVWNHPRG